MHFEQAVLLFLLLLFKAGKCYEVINALEKLINNFENISTVSTDNWFGLSIAEGLFKTSLRKRTSESVGYFKYRKFLLEKIRNIKESSVIGDLDEMPINKHKIINNILNVKWNQMEKLTYKMLTNTIAAMPIKDYIKMVDVGNPSREFSDFCLSQIDASKSCTLNVECMNLLLSEEVSYGYHRTHQALILLLLTENKCNRLLPMTTTKRVMITTICSKVYSEIRVMLSNDIPIDFRDLFLEQVLMCGIGGFTEFMQKSFIAIILSWQNDDGCFSLYLNDSEDRSCYNHITSLALTFLSNLIKAAFQKD